MDAWKQWLGMARGSLIAAQSLAVQSEIRSSISRAYYAAYQAVTTLLLYARLPPPEGREGWSHEATPDLLKNIPLKILNTQRQQSLIERLEILYDLRLSADYHGNAELDNDVTTAVRSATFIVRIVADILPGE